MLGHRGLVWAALSAHRRSASVTSIALCLTFAAGTARAEEPEGLTSEPPRGSYVRVDGARLVDPVGPQAADVPPHIIYLQRCEGGLELTPGQDSSIDNTSSIIAGPITLPAYAFGNESWQDVVDRTRFIFSPFNIEITDVDPGDVPHDEAMVCGAASDAGFDGAGGVAPFNCGIIPNAITFTFPDTLGNNPQLIAEVIAQEVAHAWGLDHAYLCEDPMTYLSGCGPKTYQDIDAECGEFEPRPCDCGAATQNSYRLILAAFGPAIPDIDPPTILITAPLNGTTYAAGDGFTVIASIFDESAVPEADLYINGMLHEKDTLEPWGWQVSNLPDGLYTLEIVARDENGNEGLSTPSSVLVNAANAMDSDGEDGSGSAGGTLDGVDTDDEETDSAGLDGEGGGCGCAQGAPDRPWLAAAPLLMLLGLRRRRA